MSDLRQMTLLEEFAQLKEQFDMCISIFKLPSHSNGSMAKECKLLSFYSYSVYAIMSSFILEHPNANISNTFIPLAREFSEYVSRKCPSLNDSIAETDEEIGMSAYHLQTMFNNDNELGSLHALFAYTNNEYHRICLYSEITCDETLIPDARARFDFGISACLHIIQTLMQCGSESTKTYARNILSKIISGYIYPGL